MKKIVYLVAPLMVMPFLVGCNKVKTHKVQSVQTVDAKLTFTTMKGKDLNGSAFNHKQKFKFKVESISTDASYFIDPNGIGIYIGKDATMPLFEGVSIEYTKKDRTAATVTVAANEVTDDIYIRSIAGRTNNYIYSVPLMVDVQMSKGTDTLGWKAIGEPATFNFEGIGEATQPNEECFLYTDDAETFYYYNDGSDFMDNIDVDVNTTSGKTTVTVAADAIRTGYLLIAARNADKDSFLEAFSWDEIKEISEAHYAKYIFNLGDKKTVNVKIGEVEVEHTVRIIGFEHDGLADNPGHTAGITFQFETVISDATGRGITRYWNEEYENSDFEKATLNDNLKNEVMPRLPEDLQRNIPYVIKGIGKKDGGSWSATSYRTQLFPLAQVETSSVEATYRVPGEGKIYAYFADESTEVSRRVLTDVNNNKIEYWLRSPNTYSTRRGNEKLAYAVNKSGTVLDGQYVDDHLYGVAPAFCI